MTSNFYLASTESSIMDPCYRYQIPNPIVTVSGKQCNRTTFFENSETFCKNINRDSDILAKYLSFKLACSSKFDKIKNCYTFKGEYTFQKIIDHLHEFVKIYVLCPECDYPETKLIVKDKKILIHQCEACGKENEINPKYIDKVYDFIIKKSN